VVVLDCHLDTLELIVSDFLCRKGQRDPGPVMMLAALAGVGSADIGVNEFAKAGIGLAA
jgi:hypothetical protein